MTCEFNSARAVHSTSQSAVTCSSERRQVLFPTRRRYRVVADQVKNPRDPGRKYAKSAGLLPANSEGAEDLTGLKSSAPARKSAPKATVLDPEVSLLGAKEVVPVVRGEHRDDLVSPLMLSGHAQGKLIHP